MNSVFQGKKLKLTIYGGSHENEMGFVLEGFPKQKISFDDILKDIERRKPKALGTTSRRESDKPFFISGFEKNYTTGEIIEVKFKNQNFIQKDYHQFYDHPRPGHVDLVVRKKYEADLIKGASIFSGRMTLPMVVAGSLCKQALNFEFKTTLEQVGTLKDLTKLDDYIKKIEAQKDSVGGIIKVVVTNVQLGIGGPLFDRLTAKIAQTVLAIPGTKGIEFGAGFEASNLLGSEFNDLIIDEFGTTKTNNSGGFNGGITNGNDLVIRVSFRPPSSIGLPQSSYSFKSNKIENLTIKGRHDVSYVRRALVIVENMIALAILDEL